MSRWLSAALVAALALPGCFFTDSINQRPAIAIRSTSTEAVFRGDHVELTAEASDPEGHYISYQWRAYACTDAATADGCDQEPFRSDAIDHLGFDVPIARTDTGAPTESLRIVLEAEDELGATARPSQELLLTVLDAPPSLQLDRSSRYGYVTNTPIDLFALVGDVDDGPANVKPLVWEVFSPSQVTHTLVDLVVPQPTDLKFAQFGKRFTPHGDGEWMIRVTARDPLDVETVKSMSIVVAEDLPPCLAQLTPIVPTGGVALPLTDPTLFQVPIVIDDLDVYPPVPADAVLGVTTFTWLLQAPGQSTHTEILGATGNSFAIDPASYTPGDVLELRVEIRDRQNIGTTSCLETDQTCAVNLARPACIQRQTWKVEIR